MVTQQVIKLNYKERKLEWTLCAVALFFLLLIICGVINQLRGVNYDSVIVPLFFFSGGIFFILFGLNGFSKGRLIAKWTPFVIAAWIKAITKLFIKRNNDNYTWKISLGVLTVCAGLVCVAIAIFDITKHWL